MMGSVNSVWDGGEEGGCGRCSGKEYAGEFKG